MKTKLLFLAMLLISAIASKAQTPCNAQFTYTTNPSGAVTFIVTTPSSSPTTNYSWNFGNGTSGYGTTVTTIYNTSGTYTVCLYVSDSSSAIPCFDSSCQTITVSGGVSCNAAFSIVPDSIAGSGNYIGINTSTTGGTYTWSWGDGTTSTGMYPYHTYASPGSYTICLTVMTAGCVDSVCNTYTLKTGGMVVVNFTSTPTSVNNISKETAQLFPNPAIDQVTIKGISTQVYQVEIFNVNGSKVMSTSVNGNHPINIANLPSNLYMVKVSDANGNSQYAKFSKQ